MSPDPDVALARLMRMQIDEDGPLPFDRFMEYALYHPQHGYYSSTPDVRAGPAGDFVTAPTLTPVFGEMMARFVAAAWERMGKPLSWWLIDWGAGTGGLVAPLVAALKRDAGGAFHGMHVAVVDVAPAHREEAASRLQEHLPAERLHLGESPPDTHGRPVLLLANELLDNLPVRLLVRREGAWFERSVAHRSDGAFDWREQEAPPPLREWADGFAVPAPDDHQVEYPSGAFAWLDALSARFDGAPTVALLVDYGEEARDLFQEPRPHGTLMAYRAHRQGRDVLEAPGTQDITAHVNWTAIARRAERDDWTVLGYTTQGRFLQGLGLLEKVAALGQAAQTESTFAELEAAKQVLLPGGMGESFKVLALGRGVAEAPVWPGFEMPREIDPRPRSEV